MNDLVKEVIRWVFGGGAVALATFVGTTAYQQGQLQIERERYLRDFLDRYVSLATKGSLDERIRFVQYWESLNVADQIGVDLTAYKRALASEFKEAETFAAAMAAKDDADSAPSRGSVPRVPEEPAPETVISPPEQAAPVEQPLTEQQAYFTSRSQTIAGILPGAKDAPALERQGFEALLANDIPAAREAFAAAESAWPEYHNVAEIHRLLQQAGNRLDVGERSLPEAIFRSVLQRILTEYSWGMPAGIKARMQELVER